MKIEISPEKFPLLGSGNLARSPGLHLSTIIKSIQAGVGRSKDGSGWDMAPTQGTGLLWELVLSNAFGEELGERIGELEKDGIFCTPDGFDFNNWTLLEHKCTWRSAGRELTDPTFWDWLVQIKSYAYVMQTNDAVLRVLFINGDYRYMGPEYRRYDLHFKRHEIEETWSMILNHRDKILRERGKDNDQ